MMANNVPVVILLFRLIRNVRNLLACRHPTSVWSARISSINIRSRGSLLIIRRSELGGNVSLRFPNSLKLLYSIDCLIINGENFPPLFLSLLFLKQQVFIPAGDVYNGISMM